MKSDPDTLEHYPYVVVEQYTAPIIGTRIAAFVCRDEANLFRDAMNAKHPDRDVPYVTRKIKRVST